MFCYDFGIRPEIRIGAHSIDHFIGFCYSIRAPYRKTGMSRSTSSARLGYCCSLQVHREENRTDWKWPWQRKFNPIHMLIVIHNLRQLKTPCASPVYCIICLSSVTPTKLTKLLCAIWSHSWRSSGCNEKLFIKAAMRNYRCFWQRSHFVYNYIDINRIINCISTFVHSADSDSFHSIFWFIDLIIKSRTKTNKNRPKIV